jgi:hypothetical protein
LICHLLCFSVSILAPSQGWANLGKINSRRIPPPANLPSLKSETGTSTTSFDPIIPSGNTSHGWTATGNQTPSRPLTPSKQPTQQQIDSLPAHTPISLVSSLPISTATQSSSSHSSDLNKHRTSTTWSSVTASNTSGNTHDQPPNLLGLNDFPRLVTQDSKTSKASSESLTSTATAAAAAAAATTTTTTATTTTTTTTNTVQGPSFRPANLSSWKDGGGRVPPPVVATDLPKDSNEHVNLSSMSMQSPIQSANVATSLLQQPIQNTNNSSYSRMYPQSQSSNMV